MVIWISIYFIGVFVCGLVQLYTQHLRLVGVDRRRCSAVKDVPIQWDAMIGQNVLHIIACEMNPEYFRMVFYIINSITHVARAVVSALVA